ncbi:MAG: glycosyltransferase family 4 protein [Thermoleophilia bacterium]|nr:glycosyltransferase family 4 protein [Thermoleophilia bacterium]
MNVAFDMSPQSLGNKGAGRYTRELSAALSREGGVSLQRVGVSQPRTPSAMHNAERAARAILSYPFEIGRQAARSGADLLHLPAPIAPVRAAMPVVLTIHDVMPWRHPGDYGRVALRRERAFTRRLARSARRVLVPSQFTRGEVIEYLGVDPDAVAVVPHGVDGRFRPQPTGLVGRAQRFGIPPGPFVLWVGTSEPRKNAAALEAAFRRVRREMPDVHLVMAGPWAADPSFDDAPAASEHGVIRPGVVTDEELSQLYSEASCFVFPSRYEGFGLPLLEAMACGTPVIAANVGAMPEVVGDAGLLVDPDDEASIASAIESVLSSPALAADLRQRGLERAREFTWAHAAARTAEQYRQVLGDDAR